VVSDVGAIGETVRRFGAGEAVPPEDPAALAAACVRLLSDDRRLAEAFAGVEAARKALTWDASAEAHEQLYDEIARC
jgi:glycosyltransferase involved in cell wall biosynthesis